MMRLAALFVLCLSACTSPDRGDSPPDGPETGRFDEAPLGDDGSSPKAITWTPLEPLPVDRMLSEFVVYETLDPNVEVWTVDGSVVVGHNDTDEPAFFEIGRAEWRSYAVELDVLLPADQTLRLAIGSGVIDEERRFHPMDFAPELKDWFTLRLEVEGDRYAIRDLTSGDTWRTGEVLFQRPGFILFLPTGHHIALRNVQFSRAQSE